MGRTVKREKVQEEMAIKIVVKTRPNGYEMSIDGKEYMYFNHQKLMMGMLIHLGLERENYMSVEDIDNLMEAIMDGSLPKELFKENRLLRAELAIREKELQEYYKIKALFREL